MQKIKTGFWLFMLIFLLVACDSDTPSTTSSASGRTKVATQATSQATAVPTAAPTVRAAPTALSLTPALAKKSKKVDALFQSYMEEDSPGTAVMVIQDGKIVHSAGYGLANIAEGMPITPHHLFHIASIGKQFTALGVMMLQEQSQLDYDDPIGDYLPELSWMSKGVTIRRLLHHTSGIHGYDNDQKVYEAMVELADEPSNAELLAVLSEEREPESRPGNKYSYSNTGYDLLGLLIERLSGQSYAEFMQENIFDPLGMTHSFALPNPAKRAGSDVAISYASTDGEPDAYEWDNMDNVTGSGAIYTSIEELYLYDQALYTDALVEQSTLAEAFKSGTINNGNKTDYGFAWELGKYSGERYMGHSGYWLAFDSYYVRFPKEELSIIVLFNFDYDETGAESFAFEIADIYLP